MEPSDRQQADTRPTATRSKTGGSKRAPRHERWLVEVGFAERRDGRLRPTDRGREVGSALFGYGY